MSELIKSEYEYDSGQEVSSPILSYQTYVNTILMYKQYLTNMGLPPKEGENFVGGMPVTLDKDCLPQVIKKVNDQYDYHMTLKVDGERFLC